MREGWSEIALGDVFAQSNARLGTQVDEPQVFSISKYEGVVPAGAYFDKRIASANLDTYKRLEADWWLYSTIHIDEGSIARNRTGSDGVVSPMYTVMRWDTNHHDPAYFELLLRSKKMLGRYFDSAQGSINRRRSLPWRTFSAMTVTAPPLNEQKRVVDLIAAVDDAIEAAEKECAAEFVLRQNLIDSNIALEAGVPTTTLGALGTFERGRRFTKKDYVEEGLGCIHYGQIYTDYGAVAYDTITYLPDDFRERARLAHPGDLVIAGTGENTEEIGKAVAWLGVDDVAVHDDAFIYRHELDPAYASALLASSLVRGQFAPSDSKVARLSANALAGIIVPVLRMGLQVTIGQAMMALDTTAAAARGEADSLRALRTNILTVLLSGEREISPSYDRFLKEALA